MQVSCNRSHVSRSDCLSQWYQDELSEDWSDHWLRKLTKHSWYMSVSQICELLLMIHTTLLKDSTISDELDQEEHEVSMRHNMWMCVQ